MATWLELHLRSERFASSAREFLRRGHEAAAEELFAKAALAEEEALERISRDRRTTLGAIAISASALWLRAKRVEDAARVARLLLRLPELFPLAHRHLALVNAALRRANKTLIPVPCF